MFFNKRHNSSKEQTIKLVWIVISNILNNKKTIKYIKLYNQIIKYPQTDELGWGAYILVVALSIHSILEGIAIGLADTVEDLITLFLSVIIHEVSPVYQYTIYT